MKHFYGLSNLQLNTRANCSVYNRVQVAALFSKVISGTDGCFLCVNFRCCRHHKREKREKREIVFLFSFVI